MPFVPIDASTPPERVEFVLKDTGAGLLVVAGSGAGFGENTLVLSVEDVLKCPEWDGELVPSDVHHYIYTSGSTGMPKGKFSTRFECSFTSFPLVSSVVLKVSFVVPNIFYFTLRPR